MCGPGKLLAERTNKMMITSPQPNSAIYDFKSGARGTYIGQLDPTRRSLPFTDQKLKHSSVVHSAKPLLTAGDPTSVLDDGDD